jgi:hypothetical protein
MLAVVYIEEKCWHVIISEISSISTTQELHDFWPEERDWLHTKYYSRICTVLCILAQRNDEPLENHSGVSDMCAIT